MMKYGVQKMVSLLMVVCLTLGLGSAFAQGAGELEALEPLMDLVCAAAQYGADDPDMPISIPGEEGVLTVAFTDTFIKAGLAYEAGARVGVTDEMLANTAAQSTLFSGIFAAQLPQLEPVTVTEGINAYIGFQPVTVNGLPDGSVQIIGEMYLANKPFAQLTQAEVAEVEWLNRAVFTFRNDPSAYAGFRLHGFSVGTDLAVEAAIQGYFEQIAVEYVNTGLGFSLLYPAVFTDDMLVETADGVSAELPDQSVSFFAKRVPNTNGATLADYVGIVANGITDSVANIDEASKYGTVAYTTDDGYVVYDVYIISDQYIYQAEISYRIELIPQYSMFNAYLENSFVAEEVSVG